MNRWWRIIWIEEIQQDIRKVVCWGNRQLMGRWTSNGFSTVVSATSKTHAFQTSICFPDENFAVGKTRRHPSIINVIYLFNIFYNIGLSGMSNILYFNVLQLLTYLMPIWVHLSWIVWVYFLPFLLFVHLIIRVILIVGTATGWTKSARMTSVSKPFHACLEQ